MIYPQQGLTHLCVVWGGLFVRQWSGVRVRESKRPLAVGLLWFCAVVFLIFLCAPRACFVMCVRCMCDVNVCVMCAVFVCVLYCFC
jgi:hypothetical protein